jgi:hypothetical protein
VTAQPNPSGTTEAYLHYHELRELVEVEDAIAAEVKLVELGADLLLGHHKAETRHAVLELIQVQMLILILIEEHHDLYTTSQEQCQSHSNTPPMDT